MRENSHDHAAELLMSLILAISCNKASRSFVLCCPVSAVPVAPPSSPNNETSTIFLFATAFVLAQSWQTNVMLWPMVAQNCLSNSWKRCLRRSSQKMQAAFSLSIHVCSSSDATRRLVGGKRWSVILRMALSSWTNGGEGGSGTTLHECIMNVGSEFCHISTN